MEHVIQRVCYEESWEWFPADWPCRKLVLDNSLRVKFVKKESSKHQVWKKRVKFSHIFCCIFSVCKRKRKEKNSTQKLIKLLDQWWNICQIDFYFFSLFSPFFFYSFFLFFYFSFLFFYKSIYLFKGQRTSHKAKHLVKISKSFVYKCHLNEIMVHWSWTCVFVKLN